MKISPLVLATAAQAVPLLDYSLEHVLGLDNQVLSVQLQDHISAEGLEVRANDLYTIAQQSINEYNNPTRVIGSKGHLSTLQYIQNSLDKDYYQVSTQKLDAVSGSVSRFWLKLGDDKIKSAVAFSLSPPTPDHKSVNGKIIVASNQGCDPSDFDESVKGSVVIVERGICPFGQKSLNAGKAGALACIIANNEGTDESISGTLGTPQDGQIATFGVSKNVATDLKLSTKKITALMDSYVEIVETLNVIAETRQGDHDNVVMLGAHSDSVDAGPGINDDGSGTISLLEVANALAQYNVTNAVRFAWWAAEEEGLIGSDYYCEQLSSEENQKIRLFMDYDMMASPNYAYQVYDANNIDNPTGSEELKQLYVDFYKSVGVNYTFVPFDGRSDYDGFIRHGIPGGGVATGAEGLKTDAEVEMFGGKAGIQYDPCYHLLCDNLNNVDYEAWVVNTKLIAHSVGTYAQSLQSFPKRTAIDTMSVPQFKYHGTHLIM